MITKINTILLPIENFIKQNTRFISRFLLILSVLILPLIFVPSLQKNTGEQARNVLYLILFLPILARVFSFSIAQVFMPLRKELGILMGSLAWAHGAAYMLKYTNFLYDPQFWWQQGFVSYLVIGLLALIVTTPLLLTSNNYAIKLLGKRWKLLHRSAYLLVILVILHIVLIQWAKSKSIDYATLSILGIYFTGKILEWKGVRLGPGKTYKKGQKFLCIPCGYIYDPVVGDIEDGIMPGTEFVDIPESWRCPVCGVTKADFVPYDEHTPMESYPAKVIKKTLLNATTLELTIETEAFLLSKPGQFVTFLFSDNQGDFSRPYSITQVQDKYFTFVIKLVPDGRGSALLHNLQEGERVSIRGIYGQFELAHTVNKKIFLATGTGLAPIINMIRSLPLEREKSLYFSVSTESELFYTQELHNISNLDLHIHITRESVVGYETVRINVDNITADNDTEWYLCGNIHMITQNKERLIQKGYSKIYIEQF